MPQSLATMLSMEANVSKLPCITCAGGTVGVIVMKIGMYIMCRKSSNSSVQAFALDHINDVVVNSVGLVGMANLTCRLLLLHVMEPVRQPDVSGYHFASHCAHQHLDISSSMSATQQMHRRAAAVLCGRL